MVLIVTPAVYPHLFVYYNPLNLESQNQAKNIPLAFPSSTIKLWDKLGKGFLSYDRTNKQTNKQRLQLYIYIDVAPFTRVRSKIISDQKRLFIVLSLYPLSFFANTTFNWPELKDLIQLNRGLTFLHLGMLIHITQLFFHLKKQILMNARRQCKITTQLGVFLQYFKLWEFFQKYNIRLQRYNTLYFTYWLYFIVFPSIAV